MSGKKMNIYDALDFSEGASYAVMCYNLYGNGTEPGTKADLENIRCNRKRDKYRRRESTSSMGGRHTGIYDQTIWRGEPL